MKQLFKNIWNLLEAIGEAKYAADLARNGKHAEAQAIYKD